MIDGDGVPEDERKDPLEGYGEDRRNAILGVRKKRGRPPSKKNNKIPHTSDREYIINIPHSGYVLIHIRDKQFTNTIRRLIDEIEGEVL